jgi:hypothetical protein
MYDGCAHGSLLPCLRASLIAAIAILACLTLGPSAAAAEEPEGGGGETPPAEETPSDPPAEPETTPVETTPAEPETTPAETPSTTPESPHPTETPSESSGPGPSAPSAPAAQAPGRSGAAPAPHHSSGGSSSPPQHTSGGTGKGIKVTNPLESISSGVDDIFSGALAPRQLDRVGKLLADSGLAPRGNKAAQHEAARKIINALGAAVLGPAVGLSPTGPVAASQPIPFVPIHGGPKYLYIALLLLLLTAVAVVLFHQLRPVIRSRQPRPPLLGSLDTGTTTGVSPGRVPLPREPARRPERPSPARRQDLLGGRERT